jgi:hypothetical protein
MTVVDYRVDFPIKKNKKKPHVPVTVSDSCPEGQG